MSREELPAGRELDALIGERVMGLPRLGMNPNDVASWRLPFYSTSISAAWEVVERLAGKHTKRVCHLAFDESGCWARFHDTRQYEGLADTAPLAICRAALRAVGAQ